MLSDIMGLITNTILYFGTQEKYFVWSFCQWFPRCYSVIGQDHYDNAECHI